MTTVLPIHLAVLTLPLAAGAWAGPASLTKPDPAPAGEIVSESSELLVFLKSGIDAADFAQEHGVTFGQALKSDARAFVFTADSPDAAERLSRALSKDARVRSSTLNLNTRFIRMSFVPNDPYFHKNTPSGVRPGQWHLVNENVAGMDSGVEGAWLGNITGSGVTIGIVDDSFETTHPDLAPNYSAADSYDFGQNDAIPDPVNADDEHGISVAGVAAARGGNGIGVTGAAPHAGLAGLRIDFPTQTTQMFVDATLYHSSGGNTSIKVKNHSYGYNVPYVTTTSEQAAVATSTASGTIHVFAAGNNRGGSAEDSATLDIQNSPDVIAVAALGSNGQYASYSNYGASVFVAAPSSGGGYSVTTTDRTANSGYNTASADSFPDNNYTSLFGGTSSASPLVAGIMALAKEAQPNLNTRFAKHMLVRTSDIVHAADATDASDGGWKTNAAGNAFNQNYGFGRIDAEEFSLQATQYSGVTTLQTESIGTTAVNAAIPDYDEADPQTISRSFTLNSTTPLEDLQVALSITHTWRGDLEAFVTSPSGTSSRLFNSVSDSADNVNWTFLTNAFWGENPQGVWQITVADVFTIDTGTWNSYSVTANMGQLIEAVPGDADYDGDVDLSDLSILAANYGRTDDGLWKFGDFDLDFDVDLSDLGALATHYDPGEAQAFADFNALAVPEPAAGAIFIASLFVRRRRSP
jgi:subtilisin-like proprotein convertase family protein